MRPISVILLVLSGAIAGGIIVHICEQKPLPVAPPLVAAAANQPAQAKIAAPKTELLPMISTNASAPEKISTAVPVISETKPDAPTNVIAKLVDDLLSVKNGAQKHALFQQMIKDGQLDAAIAELKQRANDSPNDPEIPTTLGEAQLNELRSLRDAGGDLNDQGILAMQADQSFNAALKIDPANYEAQLVKSISQTFWPADPARDGQLVQTLAGLIDRQETMTPSPDFAQTYFYLGNEYQKIGQPDKAQATWQLGLQKFPNDPMLLKKISGQ